MVRDRVNGRLWNRYKGWLLDTVGFDRPYYEKLMDYLHNRLFVFFIDFDANRAQDGVDLRDLFGLDIGYPNLEFNCNCCVLEMLVSLALRIENEYIGDPKEEHPERIFWEMIRNLGLSRYRDGRFDRNEVEQIVNIWLYRTFDYNGDGSIFPLRNPRTDQRQIEIWSEMNEYLTEKYPI